MRRLLQYFQLRQWRRALENFPLWMSTLPFVMLTCALLVAFELASTPRAAEQQLAVAAIATVLFLLRDFGILLFLNLGRIPKRADMLTILSLALLYGVIPTMLAALEMGPLTGLFWPVPGVSAGIILPAALFQALAMLWLLARRWRWQHRHA